jgi:hypothetical protein
MVKKALIVAFGFLFLTRGFSFVNAAGGTDNETTLSAKEERTLYTKELKALVKEYNAAPAGQKEEVRAQVKKLISNYTDKEIERKKLRIAKLEGEIKEINSNRDAYLDKRIDKELKVKKDKKRK